MALSANELNDIVEEVEQPFKSAPQGGFSVRERMRLKMELQDGRYDFTKHLPPSLREKISMGAPMLRHARNQLVAGMRNELRLHLEPRGNLKRHDTAADRREVYEAHLINTLIEPYREHIHQQQAGGFFWAGRLEMQAWDQSEHEPAKGESTADYTKRLDNERSAWAPWRISELMPDTVAFMEADSKLTYAVCRYKLPVIDIVQRFGGATGKDEAALAIFNESFAWIRADRGQSEENRQDFWDEEIEIVWVADKGKICYGVKAKEGQKELIKPLGEGEYDNPFGDVPLLLASGVYLYDRPVGYRREGLLSSLDDIEFGKALLKSLWASNIASPPVPIENKIPAEVDAEEITSLIDENGSLVRFSTKGEISYLDREVDATQDKLYSVLSEEGSRAGASGLLLDQEGEVKDVAASVQLVSVDERKAMIGSATKLELEMIGRCLDMVQHAQVNTLNKHRGRGEPKSEADWPYAFHTAGNERVKGRKVDRGELIEIRPQDLDVEMTRSLDPEDDRLSTKQAQQQYAQERYALGAFTHDEKLEAMGVEDVTGFNERKLKDALVQADSPRVMLEYRTKYAQMQSAMTGRSVQEIALEIGVSPEMQPEDPEAGGPGLSRFGSPVTEPVAAAGVTS